MGIHPVWRGVLGILPLTVCICAQAAPECPLELARLREGRTGRSSSAHPDWRNKNGDCRPIEMGQTLIIADLAGPGVITHMWFTIAAEELFWPRMITLRVYYDDSPVPAVETPIGDFFAMGNGLRAEVNSEPVSVSAEGRALNSWWPMPFRKHIRVTLTNDSPRAKIDSVYYYVDWQGLPSLPEDVGYFHARYRQEHPCVTDDDYMIADITGRGHYVGTVLSVRNMYHGWFGEGDDRFFIDGEEEPSIRGTGTEDYFGDAWGFRRCCFPYHGVPIMEGGYIAGDRITAYRWHIKDPVVFNKSLKVTIEHKGSIYNQLGISLASFVPRKDWFSSVAFWYQQGTGRSFGEMPPAAERLMPHQLILGKDLLKVAKFEPMGVVRQEHFAFVYVPAKEGASFTVPFNIERSGWYDVEPWLPFIVITGIWEPLLDEKPTIGPVDTCDPATDVRPVPLGLTYLQSGQHTLKLISRGMSPKSPRLLPARLTGGLAALVLTEIKVQPPPAAPRPKTTSATGPKSP